MAIGDRVIGLAGPQVRSILGDVLLGQSAGGTTQANSPVLAVAHTQATTCAAGAGFTVPANLNFGDELTVANGQAVNAMLIWPPLNGQFNNLGANASFSVPASKSIIIKCLSPTQFTVFLSA